MKTIKACQLMELKDILDVMVDQSRIDLKEADEFLAKAV